MLKIISRCAFIIVLVGFPLMDVMSDDIDIKARGYTQLICEVAALLVAVTWLAFISHKSSREVSERGPEFLPDADDAPPIDYRLKDLARMKEFFATMEDDQCALMGNAHCTKCNGTQRSLVPIPDWALSPAVMLECKQCGEKSCVFVYDVEFRRIVSTRQEKNGWCRMPGEHFKKTLSTDHGPTLQLVTTETPCESD